MERLYIIDRCWIVGLHLISPLAYGMSKKNPPNLGGLKLKRKIGLEQA